MASSVETLDRVVRALQVAKAERRLHSEKCARWDYEANDCETCDAHDLAVRELNSAVWWLREKAGV